MYMSRILFKKFLTLFFLLFSVSAIAQPLPCPPINTTSIDGWGDTTICNGECTTIGCNSATTIKSTSSYVFSTIPYLPTSFTGGTPILVGTDDVYSGIVDLPFPFCFYGTKYNQCVIGANGNICFDLSLAGGGDPWLITSPLPAGSNTATLNSIMGAYYDIDPGIPGGSISWAIYGTAPCRTFVVSWNHIPLFDLGHCPGLFGTQQIVLYESTYAIDIFIHEKPNCTAWNSGFGDLGIEDATGANYMMAPGKNGTVWSVIDSAYRFTPDGPATWTYTWYDHSGAIVGSGSPITVCPTDSMTYIVKGVATSNCDSFTVYDHVFVNVGPNPAISKVDLIPPSRCGQNDGKIKLHGLVPGISDTIYYKFNGVLQPYVVEVSPWDSVLTLSGLCEGIYDSIVVKVGKCHSDPYGPYTLLAPPLQIGTATLTNPSKCGLCDGYITIDGLISGLVYTLNYSKDGIPQAALTVTVSPLGTVVIPGLCRGDYSNIYLSITGPCAPPVVCNTPVIGPFTLIDPPPPVIKITSSTNPTECGKCNGTITMRAAEPFSSDTVTYTYNTVTVPPFVTITHADSSLFFPGLCAGSYYSFTIKVGACTVNVPGTVILTDPPLTASFNDNVVLGCHGDSVFFHNLSASTGKLYYLWSFGDGSSDSVTNPTHVYPAGTYTVHLTATNHYCNSYDSTTFTLGHPLKAVFTETPDILCQGQTAVTSNTSLGATGYQWYFTPAATDTATNATYTYQRAGTYNLTLIAHNDIPCYDTAVKTVYVDTISGFKLNLTDSVACSGTYITFTGLYAALGNTGITWKYGDNETIEDVNPVKHSYAAAGTYTISATAHYRACPEASGSRIVSIFPQPIINIGGDTSICKGSETITLSDHLNNNPLASYLWNTGERTRNITIVAPGKYYATVNINNCYASDTIEVANDCYVNIPNAFTPNGDGINDFFFPRQLLSRGLIKFSMNIYNRWGQLVFATETLDGSGWDGKLNGVDQPSGVFVYVIDATFKDGQEEHHKGNVTLLR